MRPARVFSLVEASRGALQAGAAIGGTVGLEALFAGPISGASMNPARSLAPALVALDGSNLWIFLAAPVLGALWAVLAYRSVYGDRRRVRLRRRGAGGVSEQV